VRSEIQIAQIVHPKGARQPYLRPLQYLLGKLPQVANVEPAAEVVSVTLSDPRLFDYPILYWSGDRAFPLPQEKELANLRQHLLSGGFLLFDDAVGSPGNKFEQSVKELLSQLFPQKDWERLPRDHSLFRSFYLLRRAWGRNLSRTDLYGLILEDRTVLAYFPGDLAGALAQDPAGNFLFPLERGREQRVRSFRLGVNLVMYALTLDYKQDQIHLPFILNRRR